jgi:ribulose-phosphate 3-epimerase
MALIVPSILAGDFARLGESLDVVRTLGISAVHIDIMDGHFRPQISVGQPVVRSLRRATHLKLDVHLMIERPERYIEDFVSAGADYLAFHPEATADVTLAISSARRLGVKAGLALSPAAPVETCYEVLDELDYVLVQTGSVGSGEEVFARRSLDKVAAIAKAREARGLHFVVETEGGIGVREAEQLLAVGADILVVGSAIFDKEARGQAMRALVRAMGQGTPALGQEEKFRVH